MAIRAWAGQHPPLGVPFVLNRASPQAVGLVGWWPSVGSSGGLLADRAGGLHGVASSGVVGGVRPVIGNTNVFSIGASEQFTMPVSSTLDPTSAGFSLTAWVFPTTTTSDGGVMSKWSSGFSGYMMWRSDPGGATSNVFRLYMNSGTRVQSSAISGTRLVHVVMTWDGTTPKVYLDGFLDATGSSYTTVPNSTGGAFKIGSYSAARSFGGEIGDVRYYNRALSPAEVFALYDPQTRWQLYGVPVARRGAVLSAVFRRTLSQQGARVGSRQVAA